jgi:hypothetical protein
MPQNPHLINEAFEKIITKYTKEYEDQKKPALSEGDKEKLKQDMLEEMDKAVDFLLTSGGAQGTKGQITREQAQNAKTAIDFYKENVQVLAFQPHPQQVLSELSAIDYAHQVETTTVKPNRILTQMQKPDRQFIGSFYTEGILPHDFQQRASDSGIGLATDYDGQKTHKDVYSSITTKPTTCLISTAAPALDTWSHAEPQTSMGGGAQYRVATRDYGNLESLQHLISNSLHAPKEDKRLGKGITHHKKEEVKDEQKHRTKDTQKSNHHR